MAEPHSMNDLNDAECFALVYVQMLCAPENERKQHERKWKDGQEVMDRLKIPAADRRKMLADGLYGLRERGVIECTKDGEGDLVPTVYHPEKMKTPARIVMGDLQ